MKTLIAVAIVLVSVSLVAAESKAPIPGMRGGDSITVIPLGNGITSYWDQHGNNTQVFESGIPGLKNYSTGTSHGQIYEPFHSEPLTVPESNPFKSPMPERCPPEMYPKVYC